MSKRYVFAGVLGCVAMYIWMSIAHVALPLGQAGIQSLPNEQSILTALHSALGDSSGLYLFPGMGTETEMRKYEEKLAGNPSGLLIYHPPGAKALEPSQLIAEFLTELLEFLIAVFLLSLTRLGSFPARVGFITLTGILASLPTNISYWNWYGFPSRYTAVYMFTQIMGFVFAGLVAAWILKSPTPSIQSRG